MEPEFKGELRDLFDSYPRPAGDAAFDARFWRELDARRRRYRGAWGFARRLIEIEIEGIAVWRLGFSLFGGAALCGLGVALLSLSAHPAPTAPPQIARVEQIPTAMPRLAREWWNEELLDDPPRPMPAPRAPKPANKEEISCVSRVHGLA